MRLILVFVLALTGGFAFGEEASVGFTILLPDKANTTNSTYHSRHCVGRLSQFPVTTECENKELLSADDLTRFRDQLQSQLYWRTAEWFAIISGGAIAGVFVGGVILMATSASLPALTSIAAAAQILGTVAVVPTSGAVVGGFSMHFLFDYVLWPKAQAEREELAVKKIDDALTNSAPIIILDSDPAAQLLRDRSDDMVPVPGL